MKAWRLYDIGDWRLDDIPLPKVTPGSVLVRTKMIQPSITEVQLLHGLPLIPDWGKMLREKSPIQVFGHEFCGEVIEVGEGVENIAIGNRVFNARPIPCYKCALCQGGNRESCRKGPILGIDIPGCLAEYAAIPASCLMSIPDSITDSDATAMQPLTSVLEFIIPAKIESEDIVVVLGQGTMGINCMQLSKFYGAAKVIVTDLRDEVLTVSRKVGADIVINPRTTDPVVAIMEVTDGVGADVVFECAGGSPRYGLSGAGTLNEATRVVRDEGKIVLVGILDPNVTLDANPVISRGVQYLGPGHCTAKDLNDLIDIVSSKRLQLAPLITHVLEGLDKVPEAFEITGNKAKYGALSPAQVIVAQ